MRRQTRKVAVASGGTIFAILGKARRHLLGSVATQGLDAKSSLQALRHTRSFFLAASSSNPGCFWLDLVLKPKRARHTHDTQLARARLMTYDAKCPGSASFKRSSGDHRKPDTQGNRLVNACAGRRIGCFHERRRITHECGHGAPSLPMPVVYRIKAIRAERWAIRSCERPVLPLTYWSNIHAPRACPPWRFSPTSAWVRRC